MSQQIIQDVFLNEARKKRILVELFTTNGVRMRVFVDKFDTFCILCVDEKGKQSLLYKHAISTIIPTKSIIFPDDKK